MLTMAKQVRFRTTSDTIESQHVNGGIAIYDGPFESNLQFVICGCCGGIFEPKEIAFVRPLEWVSLSEKIVGE